MFRSDFEKTDVIGPVFNRSSRIDMTENKRLDSTFMVDVEPQKELLEPDVQVGPYIVKEEIGSGAMGAVYRAVHTKLKRTVALKLLSNSLNTNDRQLARFHREMEAIGRLDHPNIVRATDAGEYKNIHYLVMELIEGPDVQRLLAHVGPLDCAVSCEIARQTALGLQHIHDNQLVHRDIKPSNLLVSDAGVVKILDLGIAMLRCPEDGGLTIDGALMGTPDFMAPEQIDGSSAVDIRADLYSLGCTLYMLLSGHPPFSGPEYEPHVAKLIAQRCDRPQSLATLVPDLPTDVRRVIERLMAKDPNQRYQTPGEVAEALGPWASEKTLQKLIVSATVRNEDQSGVDPYGDQPAARRATPAARPAKSPHRIRRSVVRAGFPIVAGLLLAVAVLNGANQPRQDKSQTLQVSKRQRSNMSRPARSVDRASSTVPNSAADKIADSLNSVADNTEHIRDDARSIAESGRQHRSDTRRIADTLDELRTAFESAVRHGGMLSDPKSAGEFYHNARVHQLQGNNTLARQAYLRMFELGADFVDVHHHFHEFLILQEGRAGAQVVYRNLLTKSDHIARRYAQALLEDLQGQREQLNELLRDEPTFAPAYYALSRCASTKLLGRQSLTDQVTEKQMLSKFLQLHEEGHLLRYFLDQSEAATMIYDAQQRLAALQSIDAKVLENPVSVNATQHKRGWVLTFKIAEVAQEIFYRTKSDNDFQSTGFQDQPDPLTGEQLPVGFVQLPIGATGTTVEVQYTDVRGIQRGPFRLDFDPQTEMFRETKRRLELTKSVWARFGVGDRANRLYFAQLSAHREAISEVRYAVDSETPTTIHRFTDSKANDTSVPFVEVSPSARYAVVQLTFVDGSKSDIVRVER